MTLRRTGPPERRTRLQPGKPLARNSRLRPISPKCASRLDAYRAARAEVEARSGGACEMRTPVCVGRGVEAHHVRGRVGPLLTDTEWLAWTCRPCHDYVHDRPAEAYQHGWLASRHGGVA